MPEIVWLKCDECDTPYFIGAILSPRTHRYSPIAISNTPDGVPGNFRIAAEQDPIEVFDDVDDSLGYAPVVTYGSGDFRPHAPSHFIEDHNVTENDGLYHKRSRLGNFKMPMDERSD